MAWTGRAGGPGPAWEAERRALLSASPERGADAPARPPARGFCFPRSPQVRGAPCRPATPPAGRGGNLPFRSPARPRITERPRGRAMGVPAGHRPHLQLLDRLAPGRAGDQRGSEATEGETLIKVALGASEVVERAQALVVEADDLSSIPGTEMGKGEPTPRSCPLTSTCTYTHTHAHTLSNTHTHTHIHTLTLSNTHTHTPIKK